MRHVWVRACIARHVERGSCMPIAAGHRTVPVEMRGAWLCDRDGWIGFVSMGCTIHTHAHTYAQSRTQITRARTHTHTHTHTQVGEHYLAEGWGQELMTLSDFITQHIERSSKGASEAGAGGRGSDVADAAPPGTAAAAATTTTTAATTGPATAAATATTGQQAPRHHPKHAGRGYLAQHPLFEQIPALAADMRVPEYCTLGADEEEGGGIQVIVYIHFTRGWS